ncbi:MICOS complex subunit MIC13 [Caligus rogercresseyi]|uniref:MICOS complex subunit MIC13 n=1 Tax=Caligus rogercresseyi TaxID=217165 RepID=A0A7T8KA41_CALRO|nr:MICOS complex subunit MIC13 [Caligus rogercresseyi]|eukprot:TRINITY_DN591_c0_g1_i1.p1 TRINITY_DN591_c0_g1~~TRINITY_DN591_c0_g1_i1.p1  ORF type:complete len:120 (+),score=17.08 TRINITY_DN591_c0_g1_i1:67-426(+)
MGVLGTVIKSGVKLGAVGGLMFLSYDQKLWSNAEEGEKLYRELSSLARDNAPPEVKTLTESLPDLSLSPSSWNNGVSYVFDGIRHSPETLAYYGSQGKDLLVSGLESINASESKSEQKE